MRASVRRGRGVITHLTGSFEKNQESINGTKTVLNCFKMAARMAVVDCKPMVTARTNIKKG